MLDIVSTPRRLRLMASNLRLYLTLHRDFKLTQQVIAAQQPKFAWNGKCLLPNPARFQSPTMCGLSWRQMTEEED